MDNKVLFIEAHKIARSTVAEVGNYQIAFKLALAEVKQAEAEKAQQLVKVAKPSKALSVLKSMDLDNVLFLSIAVILTIMLFGNISLVALGAGNTLGAVITAAIGIFVPCLCIWSFIDDTRNNYTLYYKNQVVC